LTNQFGAFLISQRLTQMAIFSLMLMLSLHPFYTICLNKPKIEEVLVFFEVMDGSEIF